VELTVGPKQLRTLGPDYVWRVEPGKFELQLGDNAENILLRADLTVE
jgi:beta-glucosidase